MAKNVYQGFYTPLNPEKYVGDASQIVFRSSWERKLMVRCDTDPSILKWGSEIHPIPYYSTVDKKMRRYFVDFFMKVRKKDGTIETLMIEVKPNKERFPPKQPKRMTGKAKARFITETLTYQRNQDKWEAAREFAKKHNMRFAVMDEYDLGIKKRK